MNVLFIAGTVIDDVKFDFILNGKNVSISTFRLKLEDKTVVKIIAYDNRADYCYRKIKKEDKVMIYGYLNKKYNVILDEIHIFYKNIKEEIKIEK